MALGRVAPAKRHILTNTMNTTIKPAIPVFGGDNGTCIKHRAAFHAAMIHAARTAQQAHLDALRAAREAKMPQGIRQRRESFATL